VKTIGTRALIQYSVLALGGLMTLVGLGSIFASHAYPELATAGITSVLGSGLVGTIGK
jgi:hypothetical protein